jgi:four helix bundle protein
MRGGKMDKQVFKDRTKKLALRVIRLTEALPNTRTADVIGKQLLRSGTSVGANYRAACRAKSPKDMINKLGTVEEEADEALFWMELLIEANIIKSNRLSDLMKEADEILAMTIASSKTLRKRYSKSAIRNRQSAIKK